MSQAPVTPVEEETRPGYEPPRNVQFSVFLDNRVGKLLDLLEVFEGQALTVAALSVVDSSDHAVVRVLTSNSELARRLFKRNDLHYSEADVLAVEIDERRNLSLLCRSLLGAELNIHYAYPLMIQPRGQSAVVLASDDDILACQILRRKHYALLAENDMGGNAPRNRPDNLN